MGPSGAGKDTLIKKAIEARLDRIIVAPRLVTRKIGNKSEDLYLPPEEFCELKRQDRLALHWASHGFFYGIDNSVNSLLNQGLVVLVNGSRGYYHNARQIYPSLKPILITANLLVLKSRLEARAREDQSSIMERLLRTDNRFDLPLTDIPVIDNSGSLTESSDAFIELLKRFRT
jgi:ribose 1,5-bisphosphokinase